MIINTRLLHRVSKRLRLLNGGRPSCRTFREENSSRRAARRLRRWRPSMPPDGLRLPGQPGEEVVRWLDQPAPNPVPEVIKNQLVWEDLEFLDHAQRQVLFNRAFQSADHRREHLEARDRRLGQEADDPDARRHQSAAAAGGYVHDRMLRQSWLPVLHRRHRQRALGRHAARPDPEGGRRPRERHRGGLLGHRRRRDRAPRRSATSSSSRISRAACRSPTPWIQRTSFATR